GKLYRRFAEKNESRGIVLVLLAALAVNSRAIKKFITADEEQLHAACAAAFQVPRDVSRVAHVHLNSYAAVPLLKRAILSNLAIERQPHPRLIPTTPQPARQCVHDIYQCARPLQRGPFGAAHQNSHSIFDLRCSTFGVLINSLCLTNTPVSPIQSLRLACAGVPPVVASRRPQEFPRTLALA